MINSLKSNFSFWMLGGFWLTTLLNPVFKKYDYGAEYPMILLFAVLLFVLSILEFKKPREESTSINLERFFIFIFGLMVSLSFVFSETRNVGFSEVLAFLSMMIFYLVYGGQKIHWMEKFLKIVKIGAVLAVILGFLLYFWEEELRMSGPFFNILYHANVWPNAFALFLLMVWPLFIICSARNSIRFKLFHCLLIAIVISALLLTFSRGAMIVFFVQTLLLFVYFFRRINRFSVLSVVGIILTTGLIFWGSNYLKSLNHEVINVQERLGFANSESITSKQERIDFWLGAWELAKEKPFFGWGPFSFRQAYNPIQKTLLGNSDHPHNIFLKIAAENGFPALLAFLAFILTILVVVVKRFHKLEQRNKDLAFILFLSIVGAFAHNLIDYNFNFVANLLLLFIFLIFLRSLVVEKVESDAKLSTVVFSGFLALIAIFEGSILILDQTVGDKQFAKYSIYPRNSYLENAETSMKKKNYQDALQNLEKQLFLNPLDSQGWHLMGVIYCNENYAEFDLVFCNDLIAQAIKLNPKNDFSYYVDYFRPLLEREVIDTFEVGAGRLSAYETKEQALALLRKYFGYVENNVHFTAYTANVEEAAVLTDLLISGFSFPVDQRNDLISKKEKMLEAAKILRAEKTY